MPAKKEAVFEEAVRCYLQGVKDRRRRTYYEEVLGDFVAFATDRKIPRDEMFTPNTLKDFRIASRQPRVSAPLIGFSCYLFDRKKIRQPLIQPSYQQRLPQVYEQYLGWLEQKGHSSTSLIRRVLCSFHRYLVRSAIEIASLKIEHIDAFLAEFLAPFAPTTCRLYRALLRGFLRYLYHQRRLIPRDLASLVVGPPHYEDAKPPKFLRPQELQRLFAGFDLSLPWHVRTSAMVHLAYTLGLRPREISLISLDDICFTEARLTIHHRKCQNPLSLPVPEQTVKALAAYLIGVRPKSNHRTLFLTLVPPYRPLARSTVVDILRRYMQQAGVPGSAYWLRHTYAQNLLESGRSIFEIMQMLGHDRVKSSRSYLHVHVTLMRKVLFDETL